MTLARRETTLPFAGFYYSHHDSALDWALEMMFSDDRGNPLGGLERRAFDLVDWGAVHKEYAEDFAKSAGVQFDLPSIQFVELNSPREYNFTTDRIFVSLTLKDLRQVRERTQPTALDAMAREMFTSRSGFISFYSPRVKDWGCFENWDHNHYGCLLAAFVKQEDEEWECGRYIEDLQCNGELDNMICGNAPGIDRLFDIREYLMRRAER